MEGPDDEFSRAVTFFPNVVVAWDPSPCSEVSEPSGSVSEPEREAGGKDGCIRFNPFQFVMGGSFVCFISSEIRTTVVGNVV